MISGLWLESSACFDPAGSFIGPFKACTFIFGANGSGKTTIARALSKPERFGQSRAEWVGPVWTLKTYNRDFMDRAFGPSGLPGVFLLGEESKADHDAIEEVAAKIVRRGVERDTLRGHLEAKRRELAEERTKLATSAWVGESHVPANLADLIFTGYRGSRRIRGERVEEVMGQGQETLVAFEELEATARTVLDSASSRVGALGFVPALFTEIDEAVDLLRDPIVASAEVGLSPLIEKLGHSDWVGEGRQHLARADDLCPFCQQVVPAALVAQLEALFDGRYAEQMIRLETVEASCASYVGQVEKELDSLDAAVGVWLDADAGVALQKLRTDLRATRDIIRQKLERPSGKAALPGLQTSLDEVNRLIANANAGIAGHNRLIENRAVEKQRLRDAAWYTYVHSTLAEDIGAFRSARDLLDKSIGGLAASLHAVEVTLTELETTRDELHARTRSSAHAIEKINAMLDRVGFHSFRLAQSRDLKDGYQLVRDGDQEADHATLSEGERTFIAFLFFYHQLRDTQLGAGETHELVAVIDDPISSLDSDILFVIGSLIKSLLKEVDEGVTRVRQVILLTHNAHFHNEVAYGREGKENQFLRIRKRRNAANDVENAGGSSPIRTMYRSLWDEVAAARNNPATASIGLQNIMRRILENYFRLLGGVGNDDIAASFVGEEQLVCRSLISWANDGSHLSIFDSLDHSPSDASTELYLSVFEEIFTLQDQHRHYEMMMAATAQPA